MTSSELKDLLQTMVDDGRDSVDLGERELLPRIQRRRRRRATLSVASGVAGVVAIGAIAYGVQPGDGQPQVAVTPSNPVSTSGVPTCGQAPIGPSTDSPLVLAVTQKDATRSGNGWSANVATQLTNTSTKPMKLTASSSSALYLVENGVVVSQAVMVEPKDIPLVLQPGQTHTFSSVISTQRCDSAEPGPDIKLPLPASTYQLYAVHSISQHAALWEELREGPWSIRLK